MSDQQQVPHVYTAIAAVAGDLATEGVGKNRKNTQQGYNFRGIDDIYGALAPLLRRHQLVIFPRVMTTRTEERTSKSGGALFFTFVEVEFDFVSAKDGSKHTAKTVGEAMDSADKASNKAQSSAYKYVAFQVFCIPVEGCGVDSEDDHPEPEPKKKPVDPPAEPPKTPTVARVRSGIAAVTSFDRAMDGAKLALRLIDEKAPGWDTPGDILHFAAMRLCDLAESQDDLFASADLLDPRLDKDSITRLGERRTNRADALAVPA